MKNILISAILSILLFSCSETITDLSKNNNSTSKDSKKMSRVQSSSDADIADSLLTQIIGYVTQNIDTVDVVSEFILNIKNDSTKWVFARCITPSTPNGKDIFIKFYDGLSSSPPDTKMGNCEANEGCPVGAGTCRFTVTEYSEVICGCNPYGEGGDNSSCQVTVSSLDISVYESVGTNIRPNVTISPMEEWTE